MPVSARPRPWFALAVLACATLPNARAEERPANALPPPGTSGTAAEPTAAAPTPAPPPAKAEALPTTAAPPQAEATATAPVTGPADDAAVAGTPARLAPPADMLPPRGTRMLPFAAPHVLSREEALRRVVLLMTFWERKYRIRTFWDGHQAHFAGNVFGMNMRGRFEVTATKVDGESSDPGFFLRGIARDYLEKKFRSYLDPHNTVEDAQPWPVPVAAIAQKR